MTKMFRPVCNFLDDPDESLQIVKARIKRQDILKVLLFLAVLLCCFCAQLELYCSLI